MPECLATLTGLSLCAPSALREPSLQGILRMLDLLTETLQGKEHSYWLLSPLALPAEHSHPLRSLLYLTSALSTC